jgi:hypothetical protein
MLIYSCNARCSKVRKSLFAEYWMHWNKLSYTFSNLRYYEKNRFYHILNIFFV